MLLQVLSRVWDKWNDTEACILWTLQRGGGGVVVTTLCNVNLAQLPPWTLHSVLHSQPFLKPMVLPHTLVFCFPFSLPPLLGCLVCEVVRKGEDRVWSWGQLVGSNFVLCHFFWLSSHLHCEMGRGGGKGYEVAVHFQEKNWELQDFSAGGRESNWHLQAPTSVVLFKSGMGVNLRGSLKMQLGRLSRWA